MVGGVASLLLLVVVVGRGGAACEAISAASAFRVLPRALMKTSATAGCFIVAKETKMIFARSALELCVSA
jgi:hypothetical protein